MNLEAVLRRLLGEAVSVGREVGGGCISRAVRGRCASGREVFVKINQPAPARMFSAEAAGLRALAAGGCRVPEVLGVSDSDGVLVLEWIEEGRANRGYWEALGRGLAAQHRIEREQFGFDMDNYLGSTPQPNTPRQSSWVEFFRDQRLGFQQRLLREKGRCPRALDEGLDRLKGRLERWLPAARPALLHGDLWGGNAMASASGEAVIYDPAVYFGCREADLAMTQLFGGFDQGFYSAYDEAFPIEPGYEERRDVYNLYHVLNHANLFGGGYVSQAADIVRRLG